MFVPIFFEYFLHLYRSIEQRGLLSPILAVAPNYPLPDFSHFCVLPFKEGHGLFVVAVYYIHLHYDIRSRELKCHFLKVLCPLAVFFLQTANFSFVILPSRPLVQLIIATWRSSSIQTGVGFAVGSLDILYFFDVLPFFESFDRILFIWSIRLYIPVICLSAWLCDECFVRSNFRYVPPDEVDGTPGVTSSDAVMVLQRQLYLCFRYTARSLSLQVFSGFFFTSRRNHRNRTLAFSLLRLMSVTLKFKAFSNNNVLRDVITHRVQMSYRNRRIC